MNLTFEWDPRKDLANLEKHKINFAEAIAVFRDPLARIFTEEVHSVDERREIIVGHSSSRRLLLVCFPAINSGRVRVSSARHATRRERQDHENYLGQ
jgi:uncharacterized protein